MAGVEAVRDVAFAIAGRRFAFAAGATIHTENSHKYGYRDSRLLLRAAGWEEPLRRALVVKLGDLSYINPETGAGFDPGSGTPAPCL